MFALYPAHADGDPGIQRQEVCLQSIPLTKTPLFSKERLIYFKCSEFWCVLDFPHCTRIPSRNVLEHEGFSLAHNFSGFNPLSLGRTAEQLMS